MIAGLHIAAQVAVLGAVGYATSLLVERFVPFFRDDESRPGAPERMLLSLLGFVVFSVGLMVANIVTGGAVFGTPWIVPLAALAVIFAGIGEATTRIRRLVGEPGLRRRLLPWALATVLLGWLYVWPALAGGSGARTGDIPSHLGWTAQLLGGEPVPVGAAPEVPDNAYPWGFHAIMATLVRAVPGTDALAAVDAIHIVIVLGLPLAAACLARRVMPEAGWAAAGAFALIGGLGWVSAGEPDFVLSPTEARHGADLVVASPNSLYEMFPPSSPRELGLALLGATGMLLLFAFRTGDRRREARLWTSSGIAVGVTGLVSVPLFLCALIWSVAVAVACEGSRRKAAFLLTLPPAFAVFALWVGPVAAGYARRGGFVDITARLGVEWDLWPALVSWGLLLPLAIGGAVLCIGGLERRHPERRDPARALLLLGLVTTLLLALAYARSAFDWAIANNATILHMGRFWPPMHLVGAALGGVALFWLGTTLDRRARYVGAPVCAALLGFGMISPVFASIDLREVTAAGEEGYVYGEGSLGPNSFVRAAADELGPDDVLSVEGPPDLAYAVFQFSGVRLSAYDDERFERNDLRIRYQDLADRWDEVAAQGGYEPDFIIRPGDGETENAIVSGTFSGDSWALVPAEG